MKNLKCILLVFTLLVGSNSEAHDNSARTAINKVYKTYMGIKNALADDDSKATYLAAKEFTAALKAVSSNQLDAKQKKIWLFYSEKLRYDGDHIAESTSIEHQRDLFGSLSKNIITVLKAFKGNDAVLYQQYCPMVKKSWLSETAAIKNPYYGKQMADCGNTTASFRAGN